MYTPKIRFSYSLLQNYTSKNNSANMGIKLYNKLPNIIKRLDEMQEFQRIPEIFLKQHTSG